MYSNNAFSYGYSTAGTVGSATQGTYRAISASNISYDTNSKDPVLMRSRVFVGSLATNSISRDDIIQMFQTYGTVIGVSVFQGYAFIQYQQPNEADMSVSALNGYNWNGSLLDVKLAITNQKQQTAKPIVNLMPKPYIPQYQFIKPAMPIKRFKPAESVYAPAGDMKRMKFEFQQTVAPDQAEKINNTNKAYASKLEEQLNIIDHDGEEYKDTLLCGECRFYTPRTDEFVQHRKDPCLFFKAVGEPMVLQCFNCTEEFGTSWNLLKHLAVAHNLTLYNAVQIQGTEEANDLIDESQEKQSEELQADQDQPGLMETDQTTQNIL